jgi:hypothetical protein
MIAISRRAHVYELGLIGRSVHRASRDRDVCRAVHDGSSGVTRRVVTESFTGPDGERPAPGTAALAEVWVREGTDWRSLRVDARPVEAP